ncbi:MAG: type II toxin-antitoxin system ParD family antitoxin [Cyanobacteria bacterium SBLK]|nr:type II toxin-antitoxin system ParD family antitoxin [Cyanobacteria bacterium SBLK]
MTITLTSEQEKLLNEKVKAGKYKTVDDAIAEALRLLDERDRNYEQWLEQTRAKVKIGLEQLDRGEGIDSQIVIQQLKDKLQGYREESDRNN